MTNKDKRQEPEHKAKVNLTNIGRFLKGYARKFSDTFGMLADYKKEQVIWRAEQAKPCTDNGTCLYCGCDTPAKYYSDEACEDPVRKCYPDMMARESWELFKQTNNITVDIDYGR